MAQSTIVQLTVDYIGTDRLGGVARGFDTRNFASPVRRTTAGTIVRYVEGGSYSIKQNEPSAINTYTVQETLSAIALVGEGMVVLTVEKTGVSDTVNQSLPTAEQMLFDIGKFAGPLVPVGSKCSFYYREAGTSAPVYYLVSESLSAIIASAPVGPPNALTGSLTSPYIPFASSPTVLSDSPLARVDDGGTINVAVDRGTSFRSDVSGLAQFGFGAAGDSFGMYTDGGQGLESFFEMYPTTIGMYTDGGSSKVELMATALNLYHTGEIAIQAPVTTMAGNFRIQNGNSIDSALVGDTISMFNTNASVVNIGRSGANISVSSTLSMIGAALQLTAGTTTVPSINIAAGVAPTSPANGDIWFDGTDIKIRVAGVTRTFTLI